MEGNLIDKWLKQEKNKKRNKIKQENLKWTYNSDFLFFIWYTGQNGSKNVCIIWNKLVSTKFDKLIYLLT
jgi:predicted ribosome quality control (RQC) complex YloA/Tae2 family protein